jgi:cytoskeletal protein RodZ
MSNHGEEVEGEVDTTGHVVEGEHVEEGMDVQVEAGDNLPDGQEGQEGTTQDAQEGVQDVAHEHEIQEGQEVQEGESQEGYTHSPAQVGEGGEGGGEGAGEEGAEGNGTTTREQGAPVRKRGRPLSTTKRKWKTVRVTEDVFELIKNLEFARKYCSANETIRSLFEKCGAIGMNGPTELTVSEISQTPSPSSTSSSSSAITSSSTSSSSSTSTTTNLNHSSSSTNSSSSHLHHDTKLPMPHLLPKQLIGTEGVPTLEKVDESQDVEPQDSQEIGKTFFSFSFSLRRLLTFPSFVPSPPVHGFSLTSSFVTSPNSD